MTGAGARMAPSAPSRSRASPTLAAGLPCPLVVDNTLWGGAVAKPSTSADTLALQALNLKIHQDDRVDMVLLPFSDGVTLARKR